MIQIKNRYSGGIILRANSKKANLSYADLNRISKLQKRSIIFYGYSCRKRSCQIRLR